MKKNIAIILATILVATAVSVTVSYCYAKNAETQLEQAFDDIDRERAIMELSEIKGEIKEVKNLLLFNNDIPHNVLQEELNMISTRDTTGNPYLASFKLVIIGDASDEEVCDELISQIDSQIELIRFGGTDA